MWSKEVIEQTKKLRLSGATYSEIRKEFPVAKSTLCVWFKDIPYPNHLYFTNRKKWMVYIQALSAQTKRKKRELKEANIASKIRGEVLMWSGLHSIETQKSLLAMLYWAEGQKLPELRCPLKFANTDPRLALLFVTLLRNCYQIDEAKLRVRIYVHWYHNVDKVKNYWSNLLHINESLFSKTYLKRRNPGKRFRKNFAGICFITYYNIDLRREIVATGYNIQELITGKIPYLRS